MTLRIQPYQSSFYGDLVNFKLAEDQLQYTATPYDCLMIRKVELLEGKYPTVFSEDERAVGFFVLDISQDKMALTTNKNSILLRSLSIDSIYQGKGLGTKLMKMLPGYVKDVFTGIDEIVLCVNFGNRRALKIYEDTGYIDTGRVIEGSKGPQHVLHYPLV